MLKKKRLVKDNESWSVKTQSQQNDKTSLLFKGSIWNQTKMLRKNNDFLLRLEKMMTSYRLWTQGGWGTIRDWRNSKSRMLSL